MYSTVRRQSAPAIPRHSSVRKARNLSGRPDHLWISPVVYNAREVKQRAHEVALETREMDILDALEQTISPNVTFCISQQEHSFTILHGDSLPRIPGPPPPQPQNATRLLDPELLHGCYWSINSIPYMGFFPINPYRVCFNDSLFSCVFERKWEVPIESHRGHWRLQPAVARQWLTLEKILLLLRDLLRSSLQVRGSQEHLPAPPPSYYRFARPHPDPVLLSRRLMRARYAFLLLGAEISFLYASLPHDSQSSLQLQPTLYAQFLNEPLVEAIRDSWLFTPSSGYYSDSYGKQGCPRHGMFLNAQTSTLAHSLLAYENFGVPVWIWWGNRRHTHTAKSVIITYRFDFTRDTVFAYLTSRGASWQELLAGRFFAPAFYKRWRQQRPRTKPLQLISDDSIFAPYHQEPWFEFLPRRDRAILAYHVDPAATRSIWAREQQAAAVGYHPDAGLFRWVPIPGCTTLVRRRVSPNKAAIIWGEYPPTQRIYCSVFDEWDLCEEFCVATPTIHLAWQEPGTETTSQTDVVPVGEPSPLEPSPCASFTRGSPIPRPLPDTFHHDPISPQWQDIYPPPSGHIPSKSDDPGETIVFTPPDACPTDFSPEDGELLEPSSPPDWNRIYNALFPADKRRLYMRSLREIPSLMDVLSDFYGLTVPRQFFVPPEDDICSQHSGSAQSNLNTFWRWMSCSRPLGEQHPPLKTIALNALTGLCDHISWYARSDNVFQQPDPTIANDWLDIKPAHSSYVLRDLPPAFTLRNVQWRLRAECTYHISLPDSPFLLQLFRATNVLCFLRHVKTSPYRNVILRLVQQGVRFSFAALTSSLPAATHTPSQNLPWRRFPFRANVLEYDQYLIRRARLFSSQQVLRAALLSGGILWRLAMEHCPDPKAVLACAGEDFTMRTTTSREEVFSEIALSQTDADIILGVYLVSSECPPPKACLKVSWFPHTGHFNRGGLGVGFWSQDAESWYQDRVHAYLSGNEQPVPQGDWSSKMKLHKPAVRFAKGYEQLARTQLDAIAPPL